MRAIASAAFLLCVPLAYAAFSGDARARLRAAATIGLNPVAIWCAAEGHNDALALAFVFAGFALVRRRRAGIGAAIVALSALIKLPAAAGAVALAVYDRRARIGAVVGLVAAATLSFPLVRGNRNPARAARPIRPTGVAASGARAARPRSGSRARTRGGRRARASRASRFCDAARNEGWIWLGAGRMGARSQPLSVVCALADSGRGDRAANAGRARSPSCSRLRRCCDTFPMRSARRARRSPSRSARSRRSPCWGCYNERLA